MTERSEMTPQECLAEIENRNNIGGEIDVYELIDDKQWLISRVKALEARNARLTEALEEIATDMPQHMVNNDDAKDQIMMARKALDDE